MRHGSRSLGLWLAWIAGLSWLSLASAQIPSIVTPAAARDTLRRARAQAGDLLPSAAEPTFRLEGQVGSASADSVADWQLRWQFPELTGTARDRARSAIQDVLRSTCIARFADDRRKDAVLIAPERAAVLAGWNPSLARVSSAEFFQLVLVHLVCEKDVEQRFDISRRLSQCRDAEEFQVLLSLSRGAALEQTRCVAARLGTDALVPLLAEIYLRVPDQFSDNALRMQCYEVLHARYRAALDGAEFFRSLPPGPQFDFEHVFHTPPRQLVWLRRPELYICAVRAGSLDLREKLSRAATALPQVEWQVSEQPWTADMVRQVAALLGRREQAERALHSWEEARSLVWTDRKIPSRQVAVSVARFRDDAGARTYLGFALDLQRRRDEISSAACASTQQVLDSRSVATPIQAADEAIRIDKRIRVAAKGEPISESIFLARKGELVAELTWYGVSADQAWADQVLRAVLGP